MLSAIHRRLFGGRKPTPTAAPVTPIAEVAPSIWPEPVALAEVEQPKPPPRRARTVRNMTPPLPHRLEYHSPDEHARALLDYLQSAGGRTGSILARELEEIHREMCAELSWEAPAHWTSIGREFRKLTRSPKKYVHAKGRRLCVYRIAPAAAEPPKRKATRRRGSDALRVVDAAA